MERSVIHDTFCLEGAKLQSRILLIQFGDSFAAIKKIDLMVKQVFNNRDKLFAYTKRGFVSAGGCEEKTNRRR